MTGHVSVPCADATRARVVGIASEKRWKSGLAPNSVVSGHGTENKERTAGPPPSCKTLIPLCSTVVAARAVLQEQDVSHLLSLPSHPSFFFPPPLARFALVAFSPLSIPILSFMLQISIPHA